MDLGFFKIRGYVDLSLFKTKGAMLVSLLSIQYLDNHRTKNEVIQ